MARCEAAVSPRYHLLFPQVINNNYYLDWTADLLDITNCGFYWGKMENHDAEKLLRDEPDGTFLLRNSVQEKRFFVSFRESEIYLHIPVQQWIFMFGFNSNANTSETTVRFIRHLQRCLCQCGSCSKPFTRPLLRNFAFSLQHLCRAVIVDQVSYNALDQLPLPNALKNYLSEYHNNSQEDIEDKFRFKEVGFLGVLNALP